MGACGGPPRCGSGDERTLAPLGFNSVAAVQRTRRQTPGHRENWPKTLCASNPFQTTTFSVVGGWLIKREREEQTCDTNESGIVPRRGAGITFCVFPVSSCLLLVLQRQLVVALTTRCEFSRHVHPQEQHRSVGRVRH